MKKDIKLNDKQISVLKNLHDAITSLMGRQDMYLQSIADAAGLEGFSPIGVDPDKKTVTFEKAEADGRTADQSKE